MSARMTRLQKLSRQLQAALDRATHPKPVRLPKHILDPEVRALFCETCEKLMSSSGCPDHPRQHKLL
jgi:hypothetical protein